MEARDRALNRVANARPSGLRGVGTFVFVIMALALAAALAYTGRLLFAAAGKPDSDYYAKLGELTLQLAVIAIIGVLAKALIEWGTAFRARQIEHQEKRMDFLRRVRAMHVTIENARDLLNAHESARTYGEQLRRLMGLRPEVEEISEDLRASEGLFKERADICAGLEGIINYLKEGAEEYVRHHADVDSGHKRGKRLTQTIKSMRMTWVSDLMEAGPKYRESYVKDLTRAKGKMRTATYGA